MERTCTVRGYIFPFECFTLGIDDEAVGWQELVGHVDGRVHQTAAIASQVDDETFGTLVVEFGEGGDKLVVGGPSEFAYFDVPRFVVEHESGVDAIYGNVATRHFIDERLFGSLAQDFEFHGGAFGTPQVFHYPFVAYAFAHESGIVDGNNAVAGQYAHFFGRAAGDNANHVDRIVQNIELYTNTAERTFQLLVDALQIFGRDIGRVGIEFAQYFRHDILYKFVSVYRIDVLLFDTLQQAFYFPISRNVAEWRFR